MPITCTFYVVIVKYVDTQLKLKATDFTIAYWGIMSLAFEIAGLISYKTENKTEFNLNLWLIGLLGSFLNLIGCVFVIAAMSTGDPIGPISALVSAQTIIVTII
jgi:hypothetical protein